MLFLSASSLCGCGLSYDLNYEADTKISSFNVLPGKNMSQLSPFAEELCIVTEDISGSNVEMSQAEAAALFDINRKEVIYSKNAHEILYPASLTKVMTALVALKYGQPEQMITATSVVNIDESGAQMCGLKIGDYMTLDQALHILLIYSANDVAMMIAENIGGTVDNFVKMMNDEAKALGATNTNFVNPHGLTDVNHYTTVYDLYLIFNEVMNYSSFNEIIQTAQYQTVYHDKDGKEKEFDKQTTNLYIRGDRNAPKNVNVIGGKTGTTSAAGHCLILLSRDKNASPYISVILKSASTDELYVQMTDLLDEINN